MIKRLSISLATLLGVAGVYFGGVGWARAIGHPHAWAAGAGFAVLIAGVAFGAITMLVLIAYGLHGWVRWVRNG